MNKRPFIIDCDTGTDDAIAIAAALHCPVIEVKAITSVNGNVMEKYTSANNLNLVEHMGKDVPVAHGAVMPLLGGYVEEDGNEENCHGATGMGSVVLPPASKSHFDPRVASELIYDVAVACKGELELLVIGPMTNIAIALCNHGDLAGLIKHIWFMGGAAHGGNVSPTAEFNIWVDPEAAHIVLQSGIPATMVGLDVTERAIMLPADAQQIRTAGTNAAVMVADMLEYMIDRGAKGGEDAVMHDALALAAAVYPACLTCEDHFVDVVCGGGYAYGHTFVDFRNTTGKANNVSVALDIDVPAFRRWLVEMVCNSALEK